MGDETMLDRICPISRILCKEYKEKGYWIDKTLGEEFDDWVSRHRDLSRACLQGKLRFLF